MEVLGNPGVEGSYLWQMQTIHKKEDGMYPRL